MKRYKITLRHDGGLFRTTVYAENEEKAKQAVCAAEGAPLSAVKTCKQVLPKIKTLDVVALEWFDRVNGNSYFSGSITVNFGLPDSFIIWMPFQYGYGDSFAHAAFLALIKEGYGEKYGLPMGTSRIPALWSWCKDNKVILRTTKHENCKRAELANIADPRKR